MCRIPDKKVKNYSSKLLILQKTAITETSTESASEQKNRNPRKKNMKYNYCSKFHSELVATKTDIKMVIVISICTFVRIRIHII